MIINPINSNNQSFLFKPLKVIQSLGWVVVAILTLPTVIGSYFAWKKLVAVWNKNERSDTEAADLVASNALGKTTTESLLKKWVEEAPKGEDRVIAEKRILDFLGAPTDILDLSNLHLSTLPRIFKDKRFCALKELHLIGNPFSFSPSIGNLDALIRFNKSQWCESDKEEDFINNKNLDKENDFDDMLGEDLPTQTPQEEKKALYEQAINQFKGSGCLASRSAAAYFDYLKSTEQNHEGFHLNMELLHNIGPALDVFLTRIKEEVEKAKKEEASLVFVPFLLAGNLFREQHIVVAVINIKNQQIEYFDPKGNRFYSKFGSFIDRNLAQWNNMSSQKFLEKLSESVFPDKQEPSIIRNINGPQSLFNKVDCGAHALDFIQTRLNTDFIPDEDPKYFKTSLSLDGAKLREELAATLEAHIERETISG